MEPIFCFRTEIERPSVSVCQLVRFHYWPWASPEYKHTHTHTHTHTLPSPSSITWCNCKPASKKHVQLCAGSHVKGCGFKEPKKNIDNPYISLETL